MAEITLRPFQAKILEYRSGFMGISAVPGSGKTWTLSQLAAKLILTVDLAPEQEVLVVTFSNSAADNFTARIGGFLREAGLLEGMGYRVRTLHGLANDIIHERPDLAGLTNDFSILDEAESDAILTDLAEGYLRNLPDFPDQYLNETLSEKKLLEIKQNDFQYQMKQLARSYIGTAKDMRLSVMDLDEKISVQESVSPLLEMAQSLYKNYQAALNYRGAVDFDDLIRLAWTCLQSDSTLVDQLHDRWPYILEDEAQDSSRLQEDILKILAGSQGNWVRVGDPNQAIYESFTTANPNLLKNFIAQTNVAARDLPESGRSAPKIFNLANSLNEWAQKQHPNMWVRDALSQPLIRPTPPGDPQPNPPDTDRTIELMNQQRSPEEELHFLGIEVKKWLLNNPESTVAVLAFNNKRVAAIAETLKKQKIKVVDSLMNLPETTRVSAGAIAIILKALVDPLDSKQLGKVFEVIHRKAREDEEDWKNIKAISGQISKIEFVENFLYPIPDQDWVENLDASDWSDQAIEELKIFKQILQNWHKALVLPTDQLILTIAQDLGLEPFELATVHKLSLFVKDLQEEHTDWGREELLSELSDIAKNERRFSNFSESQSGFNPDEHKGEVVVATLHKAKGLEWDKVFLASVNNYDFPSGEDEDQFQPERWYIRDRRNLEAELLAELNAIVIRDNKTNYLIGREKEFARNDVIRERLRLLYVGITRARKSLTTTWNTGRNYKSKEALAIRSLRKLIDGGNPNDSSD